jgi:predicted peroxiredoxin
VSSESGGWGYDPDPSLGDRETRWVIALPRGYAPPAVPHLCVVLLHSTDEPDLAVAGLATALAAARAGRKTAVWLAVEGARLGAKGVGETLSGHGRPDVAAILKELALEPGRILVSAPCWQARGFESDVLLPGATLVDPQGLSALVEDGFACASF